MHAKGTGIIAFNTTTNKQNTPTHSYYGFSLCHHFVIFHCNRTMITVLNGLTLLTLPFLLYFPYNWLSKRKLTKDAPIKETIVLPLLGIPHFNRMDSWLFGWYNPNASRQKAESIVRKSRHLFELLSSNDN